MRRRDFIGLIGAAAWSISAHAQPKPAVIGILGSGYADTSAIFLDAFKQGLHDNGLNEGHDYVLDVRWAKGDYARFQALATELAQADPRVILATTIAAARAAQRTFPATPIVMTGLIDPVGAGLIGSLSRPGGNTTGLSNVVQDVTLKGLEILRIVAPTATRIAVLLNSANPENLSIFEDLKVHVGTIGMTVEAVQILLPNELDAKFEGLARLHPDALLVLGDSTLVNLRERIATLALREHLLVVSSIPELTDAGGLIGYGPPRKAIYRRAAYYVTKILQGSKPSDLPVEQPTLIELSINLTTAKKLGVNIPDTLLARADRVIE